MVNDKIEELKKRQEELRILKERNSYFFDKREKTQDDFDSYMGRLPFEVICKYITGIRGIVSLCTNENFNCRFKGNDYYLLGQTKPKKECVREKTLKIERSL